MNSLNARRASGREHRESRINIETLEPRMLLSAGSLISTFGNQGIATVAGDAPVASVAQPDGKIITIGQPGTIRRFNTDGSLDQNFGTAGVGQISSSLGTVEFDGLALSKDGSIFVGGAVSGTIAIFHFTSSGAVDTTLGHGSGVLLPPIGFGGPAAAKFVVIQTDGKILLGGNVTSSSPFLIRINTDGSIDNTFGNGGAVNFLPARIDGVALDSSGQIVIDGYWNQIVQEVIRLTPSGLGDPSFEGQIASQDLGPPIVRSDGSMLIPVAVSQGGFYENLGVEALTSAGKVDTSFGNMGIATGNLTFLDNTFTIQMALQANGTIDLATAGTTTNQTEIAIERLKPNGDQDSSFGAMGTATATLPYSAQLDSIIYSSDDRLTAIADSSGNIVLAAFDASTPTGNISGTVFNDLNANGQIDAGEAPLAGRTVFLDSNRNGMLDAGEQATISDSQGNYAFNDLFAGAYYLASVQPAGWKGTLFYYPAPVYVSQTTHQDLGSGKINTAMPFDTTFGKQGVVLTSSWAGQSIVRQTDGKLLVMVNDHIARFTAAGAVDTSFGNGGLADNPVPLSNPIALALQSDGKILVVTSGAASTLILGRLNADGSLDKTYGASGLAVTSISNVYSNPNGEAMLSLRADNSAVVGCSYLATAISFALTSISSTGQVDSSFGAGGYVRMNTGATTSFGSVTITTGNKILLAGLTSSVPGGVAKGVLMRLGSNGAADPTFGSGGTVLTSAVTTGWSRAITAADGRIIAAGPYNAGFAAARFNADGSLDSSFGKAGLATVAGEYTPSLLAFVGITAQGGILLAGSISHTAYQQLDFDAALLTASGALDTRFGLGGQAWAAFGPGSDAGLAALLQPDGKVVIAGSAKNGAQTALVRFNLPATTPLPASISGTVFSDNNGNGTKDSSESGVSGRKLYIDKNKNGVLDAGEPTVTTSSTGTFTFSGLAAGTYRVRDVLPSGWRRTSPSSGYFDVTVTAGQAITGKNFAETTYGQISGVVFKDANANGVKDSTESVLSGWVVYLDTNNNGKLDAGERSFTTGSDGKFTFVVPAGTYHLREVLKSGFKRTVPSTGLYTITLSSGQMVSGKNFGDR